jgi:hypothetical protein
MFELTLFRNANGRLSKRISLNKDNTLNVEPACSMYEGTAERLRVLTIEAFAETILGMKPNEAISLGCLRADLPDKVSVVTKDKLNGHADAIARSTEHVVWGKKAPGIALGDIDLKSAPAAIREKIKQTPGDVWGVLVSVVPELKNTARLVRPSTSAGLYRTDTSEVIAGSNGRHFYFAVRESADIPRFLKVLHQRLWLAGFGWVALSAAGSMLERSIIDVVVGSPERLVFEGAPIVNAPLAQKEESRRPIAKSGNLLDTMAECPDLTAREQVEFNRLVAEAKRQAEPEAAAKREGYIERETAELVKSRPNLGLEEARKVIAERASGVLLAADVLPFRQPELKGSTVADVLTDPDKFVGKSLPDPIEGPSYGASTAMVLRRRTGTIFINSHAHGGIRYELRPPQCADLASPPVPPVPPAGGGAPPEPPSSAERFEVSGKERKPKPTVANARIAINALGIDCRYERFHDKLLVGGHPIGQYAGEFSDHACLVLRRIIGDQFDFDPLRAHTFDAAVQLCLQNSFDPIGDYLDGLKWDGRKRVDTWMSDYLGAEDTELNRAISRGPYDSLEEAMKAILESAKAKAEEENAAA